MPETSPASVLIAAQTNPTFPSLGSVDIVKHLRSLRIVSKDFSEQHQGELSRQGRLINAYLCEQGFTATQTDETLAKRLDEFYLTCVLLQDAESRNILLEFQTLQKEHDKLESELATGYGTLARGFANALSYAEAIEDPQSPERGMEMSEMKTSKGRSGN